MLKNVVRNSLIAYAFAMLLACMPLVFPQSEGFAQNVIGAVASMATGVALLGWFAAMLEALHEGEGFLGFIASAVCAVVMVVNFSAPQFTFLTVAVGVTAWLSWLRSTRDERAVKRAEWEREYEAEEQKKARRDSADTALTNVPDAWLLDLFPVPENTQRADLIRMVADLPEGTEYALARAHRKGVKPSAVATLVEAGALTEADADLLAGEVA